jgi:hypothetical protein
MARVPTITATPMMAERVQLRERVAMAAQGSSCQAIIVNAL